MRGKVPPFIDFAVAPRITPAYAGKSYIQQFAGKFFWDHPRLCGEKVEQRNIVIDTIGSPPPMRGKESTEKSWSEIPRITPAYAGKSQFIRHPLEHELDHPRLCGEKWNGGRLTGLYPGSPPPMRGKEYLLTKHNPNRRITPAYAGKSRTVDVFSDDVKDHPRLCGEKRIYTDYRDWLRGSPPPMRGKVHQCHQTL